MITAIAVLFVAALLSSSSEAQTRRKPARKSPVKAVQTPVDLGSGAVRTPSGLTYLVLKKGTGRLPKAGETVIYHYTGTFTNGVKFDSSWERNLPFAFKLGARQVIKGTDEGIAKLHVGDHAIMVLPPDLAYAERGFRDLIPPGSTLVFTVEILDVKETSMSEELSKIVKARGGAAEMIARYRELKAAGSDKVYVSESDLNTVGYQLLRAKKVDDAVAILKLNVEEYPLSANVYDSLGEAYIAAGQKQLAIDNYEKALQIDPKSDNAIKVLEKLRSSP